MRSILRTCDLLQFIDETEAPTTSKDGECSFTSKSDKALAWEKNDSLVYCCLTVSAALSTPIAPVALGCTTARSLWNTLETHFLQRTSARHSPLRRQLHTTRKGDTPIATYLQSLASITEELAAIGDPITNEDLVLFALNGFPADNRVSSQAPPVRTKDH